MLKKLTSHFEINSFFIYPKNIPSQPLYLDLLLFQQFDKAAADVKKLKSLPSDSDLLELYGLFKQATVGDADPASKSSDQTFSLLPFDQLLSNLRSECEDLVLSDVSLNAYREGE